MVISVLYRYLAFFPYIGGVKVPLHYYSLLYPQLDSVWRDLLSYLDESGVKYSVDKRDLEIIVDDSLADDVLTRIHRSFMMVEGYYDGEKISHGSYIEYLLREYIVEFTNTLHDLATRIENEKYDKAFESALNALRIVSSTENKYAKTGRVVNQLVFEMLHGHIPQTYINTYLLVSKGSRVVEEFAEQIYRQVAQTARETIAILRMNIEVLKNIKTN